MWGEILICFLFLDKNCASRRQEHKIPDPIGAPPSYEEALKDAQNHIQDEK